MSINNGESEIDTRTASELEQEGDHEGAAEQFIKNALGLEDEEAVPFWNQAAINFRLAGENSWGSSHEFFRLAFESTDDQELLGRISRDWAMLFLDQATFCQKRILFEEAEAYFNKAADLLRSAMAYQACSGMEYAVTVGFMGRLELLRDEKSQARQHLRHAQDILHKKHDVYELNNLIWLLKSEKLLGRLRRLPRAVQLAAKTGYHRRATEACLITISPKLYEAFRDRL